MGARARAEGSQEIACCVFFVYLLTVVLAQVIQGEPAMLVMLPVVQALHSDTGIEFRALFFTALFASGASFMSPLACPGNLVVASTGYTWRDFLFFGFPLQLLFMAGTCW